MFALVVFILFFSLIHGTGGRGGLQKKEAVGKRKTLSLKPFIGKFGRMEVSRPSIHQVRLGWGGLSMLLAVLPL